MKNYPSQIKKKSLLFDIFYQYLRGKNSDIEVSPEKQLYLKKWIKQDKMYFLRLSTGVIQVNCKDGTTILFNTDIDEQNIVNDQVITYISQDKNEGKEEKVVMMLSETQNFGQD